MIIAEIGHIKFELASLKDSEALLKIMGEAKLVDWNYINYQKVYYQIENESLLDISLRPGDVLTQQAFEELKEKEKAALEAKELEKKAREQKELENKEQISKKQPHAKSQGKENTHA